MPQSNPLKVNSLDLEAVARAASAELDTMTQGELVAAAAVVNEESYEQRRQGLQNSDFAQNISLRRWFGWLTFALVAFWMAASMTLIYLIAFNLARLTDAVLIALITTTLATVVGLLWLVLAYLFPRKTK